MEFFEMLSFFCCYFDITLFTSKVSFDSSCHSFQYSGALPAMFLIEMLVQGVFPSVALLAHIALMWFIVHVR